MHLVSPFISDLVGTFASAGRLFRYWRGYNLSLRSSSSSINPRCSARGLIPV